jgi:hypothetical protein
VSGTHRVVFLGPSLALPQAREELEADFLPPVELGDVWRIAQERPAAIGIIDGFFHQVPAVWHKEILYALSRGIAVYGAASMGALRAAELGSFGMIGVGEIASDYARGELCADEVAVLHAPAEMGHRALSEPLVNIRATLATARREAVLSPAAAERVLTLARSLHYPQRAWPRLLEALAPSDAEAFSAWLPAGRVDQKRDDALAMLKRMRADAAVSPTITARPIPAFAETVLWQELIVRETRLRDILDEFLLLHPLPTEAGRAAALVRNEQYAAACAALAGASEWPTCCRRARLKRMTVGRHEPAERAGDSDRLLDWFFTERLGWPSDLDSFLLTRGWTDVRQVLRVAASEAAFLSSGAADCA